MYELKYRSDDEMKDSGVEWLGDVPREWEVSKFKRYIKVNSGKEILDQDKIHYKRNNVYGSGGVFKKTNKILHEGESVLFGRKGTVGKPIYVNEKFWTVDTMYYSISKGNILIKILYYLLLIYDWNKIITQTALPSVVASDLENSFTAVSNIEEQQKIINFLDIKTSQFESIISKKEKLIQKLEEAKKSLISEVVTGKVKIVDGKMIERKEEEMKDSGVEWLGMIPKDWEVKKLKHIASLKSGSTITNETIEKQGQYPVYGGNGLRGYSNLFTHNGDYILIGRQGALCGNINYAHYKFWASEHAVVVSINKKVNYVWLGELLRIMNLNQYSVSAAQPGISVGMIENLYIPFVIIESQYIIAEFLNTKTLKLDKIIAKTKSQIQKLKEAKQSLISEAVTGKIDLRDWEIKN